MLEKFDMLSTQDPRNAYDEADLEKGIQCQKNQAENTPKSNDA